MRTSEGRICGPAYPLLIALGWLWFAQPSAVASNDDRALVRADSANVPSASGSSAAISLDQAQRERLVRQFAPVIWIHSKERFGPASPADFIGASALLWRRPGEDRVLAARGRVQSARLGARCRLAPGGCYSYGGFRSNQLTRPHDGRRGRPKGLSKERGFYLDPLTSARRGEVGLAPTVPVFYELHAGRELRITYWFFYGYSQPYKPFRGANLAGAISHEGDWENIDVSLGVDGTPKAVYFYGHGRPRPLPWARTCKLIGTQEDCSSSRPGHPVVYSARYSHASYATQNERRDADSRVCKRLLGRDVCSYDLRNRGFRWDPSAHAGGLRDVRRQPWYGFGGAWGNAGALGDTTGPLGPSQFKRSNDREPGEQVSSP